MHMYDIVALWGWLNEWDSFLCMFIHLCSIISWSWSYMSLHLFAEYMSYIQIWRMWLFKFSWRYQSIFMTVSHCHENKMFHDGVTTFSWQCWALTKVIYFVVVHSFSWQVHAPMKLDFVAAIHSHENIYSCVFWTANELFSCRVSKPGDTPFSWQWFTPTKTIHDGSLPRKLYFRGVRFVRVISWRAPGTKHFRGGIHSFRDGFSLSRNFCFLVVKHWLSSVILLCCKSLSISEFRS